MHQGKAVCPATSRSVQFSLLITVSIICSPGAHAASVEVRVKTGVLRGVSNGKVEGFRGVPYAAAPVGRLRWRPPQPPARWSGVRDATNFGAACPQPQVPEMIDGAPGRVSEDCLSLNVWAPAQKQRPDPVMVWIHGGGNASGAGSKRYYDGNAFARDGIVLVTINYRLGILGFFADPALTAEADHTAMLANYALMDQIAAFKWIKENIDAFGGDSNNVTLFGESAGGEDILALLTAASARDLFAKAIVESGGGWMHPPSLSQAESAGVKLAQQLGLSSNPTAEQLRSIPVQSLVNLPQREDGLVIDGRLLRVNPTHVFAERAAARVPLIIGSNSYEGSLLGPSQGKQPEALSEFNAEELTRARTLYGTGTDDASLAADWFRDLNFAAPARWIARHGSTTPPVFLYRFSYIRQRQVGRIPGAPHGSEIPYVFDSWEQAPMQGAFLRDRDLAEVAVLHNAWIAFAKTGKPVCSAGPTWPAYQGASDELIDFGAETSLVHSENARLDFVEKHANRESAGELTSHGSR